MIDVILCDIIAEEMELPDNRVVIYDQNYSAPNDENIYVTVAIGSVKIIGSNMRFNPNGNYEIKEVVKATTFNVEITSKNEDAKYRNHEIIMALTSTFATQQMEENNIRVFRTGQILDLSFIEASSALHRYRIPVIIHNIERKEKSVDYFDNFPTPQEEIDVP